jgi:hypothetical protein
MVVAFVTDTIRCLRAFAPVLMQIPFPTSALVNAADADVNVVVAFVTPSEPERSTEVEVPPLLLLPVARTYQVVGRCNDPAAGPMRPVMPFWVAYPKVGP